MRDGQDPANTNPLIQPEGPADPGPLNGPNTEEYQLTEIAHGRMLCVAHGRVCYCRVSFTGEKEWVCPDERHGRPVRSS